MCARVCVRVYLCVFVFVCGEMYHECFSMSIFEMQSKEQSNCQVEFRQCELQIQVVSCDVFRAAVMWTG